jgi:hypothetical protein
MATAKNPKTLDNLLRASFLEKSNTNIPRSVPKIARGMKWTYWIERIPTKEAIKPNKEKPENASLSAISSDSGEKVSSGFDMGSMGKSRI